jgi:hypothetical protein
MIGRDPDTGFPADHPDVQDHDLVNRFSYHPPKDGQADLYERIRREGLEFARLLNSYVPASRELSLAITALEQTVMWANAAIARNG